MSAPAPPRSPDRIAETFARCRSAGRPALVVYVMGGDPDLKTSKAVALAAVEGGADLLEIGVPFSDPIADGPTIQAAATRALTKGTTTHDVIEVAAHVRARSQVPIALMGYLNPMLSHGISRFAKDCAEAGVDALIVPDLLPEESSELTLALESEGLRSVFLVAPTSGPDRILAAAKAATGFLYFVSVTGVTGATRAVPEDIGPKVAEVRRKTTLPVVIGFGISTPEEARELGQLADGVVVGSAVVKRIASPGTREARTERVKRFVRTLRRALG